MTARVRDKSERYSPYRNFYLRAPFARLLPVLKPDSHHVRMTLKTESKAEACFYLNGDTLLVSDRRLFCHDIEWEHPRKTFVGLLPSEEESSPPSPLSPSALPPWASLPPQPTLPPPSPPLSPTSLPQTSPQPGAFAACLLPGNWVLLCQIRRTTTC